MHIGLKCCCTVPQIAWVPVTALLHPGGFCLREGKGLLMCSSLTKIQCIETSF